VDAGATSKNLVTPYETVFSGSSSIDVILGDSYSSTSPEALFFLLLPDVLREEDLKLFEARELRREEGGEEGMAATLAVISEDLREPDRLREKTLVAVEKAPPLFP
jgi:hypothetical protein